MATQNIRARSASKAAGSTNIEWVSIGLLRPNPRNARTHSRRQIRKIAASIREFGFLNPVLIDDTNMVLAGHGRLEAARLEGLGQVPVVRFGHLTVAQKRAYLIADNKIAEQAGWDREMLAVELGELIDLLPAEGFDVALTGFEAAEIDLLLADMAASRSEPEDVLPALQLQYSAAAHDVFDRVKRKRRPVNFVVGRAMFTTTADDGQWHAFGRVQVQKKPPGLEHLRREKGRRVRSPGWRLD